MAVCGVSTFMQTFQRGPAIRISLICWTCEVFSILFFLRALETKQDTVNIYRILHGKNGICRREEKLEGRREKKNKWWKEIIKSEGKGGDTKIF